jgi:hypothetical protein
MSRRAPQDAEQVQVSPEDRDLIENFLVRRSYLPDGHIRYVQILGYAADIEAAAQGQAPIYGAASRTSQAAYSLPRLVMRRMLGGRELETEEVIYYKNELRGDCRRENLELSTKSEKSKGDREGQWGKTGKKHIYRTDGTRYYVNYKGVYLGTYDDTAAAQGAIELYKAAIAAGIPKKEAKRLVKKEPDTDPATLHKPE